MKALLLAIFFSAVSLLSAKEKLFSTPPRITLGKSPAVKIDGNISDAETKYAAGMMGFCSLRSSKVLELVPADAKFNISTDGRNLYISAISQIGENGILQRASRGYNSRATGDDTYEFIIIPDPKSDKTTIYQLIANNKGAYYTIAKKNGNPIVWKPVVDIKGSVKNKKWYFEIAMPLAAIGIDEFKDGQEIGIRICRNWKRLKPQFGGNWGLQSSWSQNKAQFFSNFTIPTIVYRKSAPVVRFLSLQKGNSPDVKVSIFNPAATPVTLNFRYMITPSSSQSVDSSDKVILKANETKIIPLSLPQADINEKLKTYFEVTSADGKDVYYRRGFSWSLNKQDIFAGKMSNEERISCKYAFYPSTNQMFIQINGSALQKISDLKGAKVSVSAKNGRKIAETDLNDVKKGIIEHLWQLPDLKKITETSNPSGIYTLTVNYKGASSKPVVRDFERKIFEWEDNKLGTSDRILPRFTPIKIKNNTVSTILRDHKMNNTGLFEQITADGKKLLKNNGICFEAVINGKKTAVTAERLKVLNASDTKASIQARWQAGNMHANAVCDWDFDGVMKYTLKLQPFNGKLDSLKMIVPIDSKYAYLFHACTDGLRFNYGGKTPEKWNSTQAPRTSVTTDFVHYIWLGTESAGLSIFADSDKSFIYKKGVPAQQIYHSNGVTYLVYNLVSSPVEIKKEREFILGFQATPVKPMLKNWRRMFVWSAPYKARKHLVYDVNFLGSNYRFGGITGAGCIFPRDFDLSLWYTLGEIRKTNKIPKGYLDKWVAGYTRASERMKQTYRREVNNALVNMRGNRKIMQYLNARGMRTDISESITFMDDWFKEEFQGQRDRAPAYGNSKSYSVDPVKSFRDFSAYWYHKMLSIGITDELYWDDIFLSANYDRTLQSDSYYDEKGNFHPSVGLWNMRELIRRGAVLQLEMGKAPNNMVHMTNTALAPICSLADQNLDGEDNRGTAPFQQRYTKEYLRALTIGRQFGNLPGTLGLMQLGNDHKQYIFSLRTGAGVMLTHEIFWVWNGGDKGFYWPIKMKLYDFGYGYDHVKVWNYWEKDYPMIVSGDTSSIIMCKENEAQALICNYGGDADFTAELDLKKLGLKGRISVKNGENGQNVTVENNKIKFNLPKYDFIYLQIKGE